MYLRHINYFNCLIKVLPRSIYRHTAVYAIVLTKTMSLFLESLQ